MPELPEIIIFARQMKKELVGKTIGAIEVLQPKSLNVPEEEFVAGLTGAQITDVTPRGKWLFVETPQGWLLLSLGMGGEILRLQLSIDKGGRGLRDEPLWAEGRLYHGKHLHRLQRGRALPRVWYAHREDQDGQHQQFHLPTLSASGWMMHPCPSVGGQRMQLEFWHGEVLVVGGEQWEREIYFRACLV
jgi:hypothetical protein